MAVIHIGDTGAGDEAFCELSGLMFPFCIEKRHMHPFCILQYILTICRSFQFGNLFEN